jgi:hypothetical protein
MYNRFNFVFSDWEKILNEKFDLIINDNEAITRNLRIAIYKNNIEQTPIIVGINFPIFRHLETMPQNLDYFWRQIDAIDCSDYTTIHSYMAFNLFTTIIENNFASFADKLLSKLQLLPMSLLDDEFEKLEERKNDKKSIIYTGRFMDNKRTNYKILIHIIKILETLRNDFDFIITIPDSNAEEVEKELKNIKNLKIYERLPRKKFIDLLKQTDIAVNLYRDFTGGIGIREACAAGCVPIFLYFGEYTKILNNFISPNYTYIFPDEFSISKIITKIEAALDNARNSEVNNLRKLFNKRALSLYGYKSHQEKFKKLVLNLTYYKRGNLK